MNRRLFLKQSAASLVAASRIPAMAASEPGGSVDWPTFAGDAGSSRYSPLRQITKANVKNLKVAWVHRTGDALERPATTIECTPIVVGGVMYLTSPQLKVQALEAATGKLLWSFDPFEGDRSRRARGVNRGLTFWRDPADPRRERIFLPVRDVLYSLDAKTGKPDPGFGNDGYIDLKEHFDHDMTGLSFKHTSPVVVYKDLVITGGGGGEGPKPEAPGHVRGWDARTGKRRWIFHTVPKPGQFGNDTWGDAWQWAGGTNNWAGMALDEKRGLVFVSTGSPSFDYYGGDRPGKNLFGNSVVAIKAETGERVWHFQIVHHDTWDYDLPAAPSLITMKQGGRTIDAVVQVTKQGLVYFFERETGKPVFPVEERPMPPSTVPGEVLWPTQPIPVKPPPISRQGLTKDDRSDLTPESRAAAEKLFANHDYGPLYTPISMRGTLIHPGFRGGALWGGCSYDPERNRLYVNSDETTNLLIPKEADPGKGYRYELITRAPQKDPHGYPIVRPPWGWLTAIDLESGDFAWRVISGEYSELKAKGIPKTGTHSHGGSIATAGGLVFLAATFDKMIRAYDSDTGEILWEHQLNAGGFANPATYSVNGKQYVVIAAGGGKGDSNSGDEFVAFALP